MEELRTKLLDDLSRKIQKRKKWETVDFMTSQILIWVAIILSFITAIVAVLKVEPWVTASLAALSGSLILIDKNFTFSKRATWNTLFRVKLEKLQRDIEFKNVNPADIADKIAEVELEMEREFPNADFKIKDLKSVENVVV